VLHLHTPDAIPRSALATSSLHASTTTIQIKTRPISPRKKKCSSITQRQAPGMQAHDCRKGDGHGCLLAGSPFLLLLRFHDPLHMRLSPHESLRLHCQLPCPRPSPWPSVHATALSVEPKYRCTFLHTPRTSALGRKMPPPSLTHNNGVAKTGGARPIPQGWQQHAVTAETQQTM
jgi:hypothetical protein